MFLERRLDIKKALSKKSLFLFGPRQTGKSSYIKKQLGEEAEIALFRTLLDGRFRLRVLAESEGR